MSMQSLHRSRGFSLVELMVGVALGLLAVLAATQVLVVSEGQKRTATTGTDALVNGSLALYTIERDGKNAGYGLTTTSGSLGCEIRAQHGSDPVKSFTLTPVTLTDGASGAPDTLKFLASSKNGITLPTRITVDHPTAAANFFVDSDVGIAEGDLMIAVPATCSPACTSTSDTACKYATVIQVTKDGGGPTGGGQGQNQVQHNPSVEWNPAGGQNIMPDGGYGANDYLINLGALLDHTYSIANNYLRLTDYSTATATTTDYDLFPQIVQLQAVYGKDDGSNGGTANDGIIDGWDAATPSDNAGWSQIKALRVALVARSQNLEKETVTQDGANAGTTCTSATPYPSSICWNPDPIGSGVKIDVNIGNANPDWQRYRYRVFESTIPLRNVIWRQ